MVGPIATPSRESSHTFLRPAPAPPPLWVAVATLVSGIVIIVVDTPDLLFFLGVGLALVGAYLFVLRHNATPPPRARTGSV